MFVTHGLQVRIVDILTKGATLLDNNCGRQKKVSIRLSYFKRSLHLTSSISLKDMHGP